MGASSLVLLLVGAMAARRISRVQTASAGIQNAWNSRAIQSTFAGVRVREIDAAHAAVTFLYDLDNQTGADYHLDAGPNVVIMSRIAAGGSLSSEQQISLAAPAFLPAGDRARIALEIRCPFSWPARKDALAEAAFKELVANRLSGLQGFVLFDQSSRYQIELPAGLI